MLGLTAINVVGIGAAVFAFVLFVMIVLGALFVVLRNRKASGPAPSAPAIVQFAEPCRREVSHLEGLADSVGDLEFSRQQAVKMSRTLDSWKAYEDFVAQQAAAKPVAK